MSVATDTRQGQLLRFSTATDRIECRRRDLMSPRQGMAEVVGVEAAYLAAIRPKVKLAQ